MARVRISNGNQDRTLNGALCFSTVFPFCPMQLIYSLGFQTVLRGTPPQGPTCSRPTSTARHFSVAPATATTGDSQGRLLEPSHHSTRTLGLLAFWKYPSVFLST